MPVVYFLPGKSVLFLTSVITPLVSGCIFFLMLADPGDRSREFRSAVHVPRLGYVRIGRYTPACSLDSLGTSYRGIIYCKLNRLGFNCWL